MPRNSELNGLGLRTLAFGTKTTPFSARDFGPGQVQFAVSTSQSIGADLILWLCDAGGQELAPVHAGPPITFETDSKFVLKNRSADTDVDYCVAILQVGALADTRSGGPVIPGAPPPPPQRQPVALSGNTGNRRYQIP